MKTIAIMNHKGGCGKTTTAINLAACLDFLGRRVLLIDFDPQCHATIGLSGSFTKPPALLSSVILNGTNFSHCVGKISESFNIIPSDYMLFDAAEHISRTINLTSKLKDGISSLSQAYDFAVIDCPPSKGVLAENALHACDEVIIPIDCGFFTIHGVTQLISMIERKRQEGVINPRIRALATMYDRRNKFSREILSEMRNYFGNQLFNTVINANIKLREASSYGLSIVSYSKSARGFKDYLALAGEILEEDDVESQI